MRPWMKKPADPPDPAKAPPEPDTWHSGGDPGSAGDDDAPAGGLHEITRKTDFWFDLELARLEKLAADQAKSWAQAGLPRPSVPDDALPVEVALERRSIALFRRWRQRVRTRVQDAIHDASHEAGARVLELEDHAARLRDIRAERAGMAGEVHRLKTALDDRSERYGFRSFLDRWKYWSLIVLLIAVDWIANVPIFREILPQEPGADAMWENFAAGCEQHGALAGLCRVGGRLIMFPDVSLLALGVIAFLVFLAHSFGEAMRHRRSLHEDDHPLAAKTIRTHRRQFLLPAIAGGLGALIVVGVLFLARVQVEQTTMTRLQETEQQIVQTQARLATAQEGGDLNAIGAASSELVELDRVRQEREKRAQYARGIADMNWPILLLNLVLVIAAALAAYLAKGADLTVADPRLMHLEDVTRALDAEERQRRQDARRLADEIQRRFSAVDALLNSRPHRGWEAKAERLRAIVPIFRAENARERALDPANVAAFARETRLQLPEIDAEEHFEAPAELARAKQRFAELREELLKSNAAQDDVHQRQNIYA